MKIKTKLKRIGFVIAALLLSLFCIIESTLSIKASAETTTATNSITLESDVLDDLKSVQFGDESLGFTPENCPAIASNYSLNFLTIMEGANDELFVYVYQPCHDIADLVASSISISTLPSNHEDAVWHLYDLTLLDNSGVFDKYQVSGFKVSSDSVRFYDISRISRPYNESIDKSGSSGGDVIPMAASDDQTINEVPYEVGVLYEVKTVNGLVTYHTSTVETIEITDKIVGFVRYPNGFALNEDDKTDSHFVAFSTDRQIDTLLEADVRYISQDYTFKNTFEFVGYEYEAPKEIEKTISHDDTGNNSIGFWGKEYTWKRIESIDDFISNTEEDITYANGKTQSDLKEMQWVLRFTETGYDFSGAVNLMTYQETATDISEVTILRLQFVTDGVPYNLGVVDNSQTGPKDPIGSADSQFDDFMKEIEQMFKDLENGLQGVFEGIGAVVIAIVCIVAGCALLSIIPGVGSIFGIVFGAIFKIIGWILRLLLWFIVFPFNLIGKLFKRNKKNE